MVTGGRAMVDCLRREGVQHVFGIPGTQNLGVIDALRDAPDVKFVLTRHEQGATFMAYGFARASGRPGVVTATEGPGVTYGWARLRAKHGNRIRIVPSRGPTVILSSLTRR